MVRSRSSVSSTSHRRAYTIGPPPWKGWRISRESVTTDRHKPSEQYDIFLSFAGPDRDKGRRLAAELRRLGLYVFLDESSIESFSPISREIERGLMSSKALVAYYSTCYAG